MSGIYDIFCGIATGLVYAIDGMARFFTGNWFGSGLPPISDGIAVCVSALIIATYAILMVIVGWLIISIIKVYRLMKLIELESVQTAYFGFQSQAHLEESIRVENEFKFYEKNLWNLYYDKVEGNEKEYGNIYDELREFESRQQHEGRFSKIVYAVRSANPDLTVYSDPALFLEKMEAVAAKLD